MKKLKYLPQKIKAKILFYILSIKQLIDNKEMYFVLNLYQEINDFIINKEEKSGILCYCIEKNNLVALKILYNKIKNKIIKSPILIFRAVYYKRLNIIKWLHKNTSEKCSRWEINLAAENGYLNILKWLHKNKNERWSSLTINLAVQNKHTDVYNYLLKYKNKTLISI